MQDFRLQIVRSRRARRIALSVRQNGEVRLTIPWCCSETEGRRFAESKREWIEKALEKQREKGSAPPRSKAETEELRAMAKRRIPPMVEAASQRTGLRYNRLSLRASHTRWGSCSVDNNISISIFLADLPDELIEYVVVHELCHTVHKNHSKEFHALCDRMLSGREKELQQRLRKYRAI
ncbi:MAG: YgjP-like metallopeptidase domain-containing protein [Tidjanibacter sp.]|nr:YgjP-like metallopeptidase domain-containing protein [Tidjanibacter sp.]